MQNIERVGGMMGRKGYSEWEADGRRSEIGEGTGAYRSSGDGRDPHDAGGQARIGGPT